MSETINATNPVKLHFTRIRAEGEKAFFDDQTDIRAILPAITEITLDVLVQITDDAQLKKDYDYLTRCFRIFQIKVKEDPTDIVLLINEFFRAISKVSVKALARWSTTMYMLALTVTALFDRRDAKTDAKDVRKMLNTAKLSAFCAALPADMVEKINECYKKNGEAFDEQYSPPNDGSVKCLEFGNTVVTDIKKLATLIIGYEGPNDWELLARACDDCFTSERGKKLTDQELLIIGMAYPSYDNPCVEMEGDNTNAESSR